MRDKREAPAFTRGVDITEDARLHTGGQSVQKVLVPAEWTFARTIPRAEVLAAMQTDPLYEDLDYELAAQKLAKRYLMRNLHILPRLDISEREKYHEQSNSLARKIELMEQAPDLSVSGVFCNKGNLEIKNAKEEQEALLLMKKIVAKVNAKNEEFDEYVDEDPQSQWVAQQNPHY